jgi:NAD-dependent SIR2 family protein deacetylase
MTANKLDGNAAAGVLREIFPFEITMAEVTCIACETTEVMAQLAAYMSAIGTVVRCPHCDKVLMRVVRIPGRYLLDMSGVSVLQIVTPS